LGDPRIVLAICVTRNLPNQADTGEIDVRCAERPSGGTRVRSAPFALIGRCDRQIADIPSRQMRALSPLASAAA